MKRCSKCHKDYDDRVEVCVADGTPLTPGDSFGDSLIGRTLNGRYRVIEKLGEGSLGAVFLAEQVSIAHRVALKILRGEFAKDENFVRSFRRELLRVAAASSNHRNVITVYDFDQADDGTLFIVMEYLRGQSLSDIIRQTGALPLSRALGFGIQIGDALDAAHRLGAIHRDLKTHNIMVVDESVKVTDFGMAALREAGLGGRVTRSAVMLGTPEYLAPEQIERGPVTEKTDIYAFGVVLYEMLTGAPPFRAPTPGGVLAKHLQELPEPLTKKRADVPESVERVVLQALEKKPERRPNNVKEVIEALRMSRGPLEHGRLALHETTSESSDREPLGQKKPRGRTVKQVALVAGLVLVLVSAAWGVLSGRPRLFGPATTFRTASGPEISPTPPSSQRSDVGAASVGAPVPPTDIERQAEAARQAEATRQAEIARQAEAARQGAEARQADVAHRAELARKRAEAEFARRQADDEARRKAEAQRIVELARQAEAARQAGAGRQAEATRGGEATRATEVARARPDATPAKGPERISPQDMMRMRTQVEQQLRSRGLLKESAADRWGVTVDVNPNGIVTLTGTVGDVGLHGDAIRLAGEVPGVTEVRPSITVREVSAATASAKPETVAAPPESLRIRTQVEQRLRSRGLLKESAADRWGATVDVNPNGIVTLTGTVRDVRLQGDTIRLAREAPGVTEVRSNIAVRELSPAPARAEGGVAPPESVQIRTQVEQRLRSRGLLKESAADRWGVRVNVSPSGIVTLTGTVRDAKLQADTIRLAREVPGVTDVRPNIAVPEGADAR